jgi:hypothetical protein
MSFSLRQILFQSGLRSKPVRQNFDDIAAEANNLQSQINALLTPPAGNEVTNARDYHTVLRDRLRSACKAQGSHVITGLQITERSPTIMSVKASAGEAIVYGTAIKLAAGNAGMITAPASYPRYDIVVVTEGGLQITTGTEAASPVYPTITGSFCRPIAAIYLIPSQTIIVNADITDLRFKGSYSYETDTWDYANDIQERVSGAGVKIDGVHMLDSDISGNQSVFDEQFTDVINEKTSAAGVTIDGMKIKDSIPYADTISEKTSTAGVTIDGVLLKDSQVNTDQINEKTSAAGVTVDGMVIKDGSIQTELVSVYTFNGVTSNEWFDTLSPFVPNINDKRKIDHINYYNNTGVPRKEISQSVGYIERKASDTVRMTCMLYWDGIPQSLFERDFIEGSASVLDGVSRTVIYTRA